MVKRIGNYGYERILKVNVKQIIRQASFFTIKKK